MLQRLQSGGLLGIAAVLALMAQGCAVFGVRTVEEPAYSVATQEEDKSVRRYPPRVLAVTTAQGDYETASDVAFRRLFDYISGENAPGRQVAMTAPVVQTPEEKSADGVSISMTAPVVQEALDDGAGGGGWRMAFILPAQYTMETAPQPTSSEVRLEQAPAETLGVLRFSGVVTPEKASLKAQELRRWLEERGYAPVGSPRIARYDPPFTIAFLRRNEVLLLVGDQ